MRAPGAHASSILLISLSETRPVDAKVWLSSDRRFAFLVISRLWRLDQDHFYVEGRISGSPCQPICIHLPCPHCIDGCFPISGRRWAGIVEEPLHLGLE